MDLLRTRGAILLFALCPALALAGCQELVVGERANPGEIDYADDLYAVTGVGENHLWVAGYFGSIYHTSDGGQTWRRQDSGTQRPLYAISFADELHGWAAGRRGFIIHTRDGGQTWLRQRSPRYPPRNLLSLAAIDPNTAWAIGDWGSRYVTRDGGESWEDRSFLVDEDHPSFPYLSDEELAAFERGEKVYDDIYLNDVTFVDAERGWIAGEYGLIFRTEDGGASWTRGEIRGELRFDPVPFPRRAGDVARAQWDQLFEVSEQLIRKPYLRVRIEGFLTPAELRRTGDTTLADDRALSVSDFLEGEGVSQDRVRQLNTTPFDQEGVDMESFTRSKLRDPPMAVIHVIETPFLFDVKFRDGANGLIAGLGGVILQSEDGGRTWSYRESGADRGLYAVARGSRALWAVGERGLHRVSLDGGVSWRRPRGAQAFQERFGVFGFMRDMVFPTARRGWIVGQGGLVLRSSDGGESWERVELIDRRPGAAVTAGE